MIPDDSWATTQFPLAASGIGIGDNRIQCYVPLDLIYVVFFSLIVSPMTVAKGSMIRTVCKLHLYKTTCAAWMSRDTRSRQRGNDLQHDDHEFLLCQPQDMIGGLCWPLPLIAPSNNRNIQREHTFGTFQETRKRTPRAFASPNKMVWAISFSQSAQSAPITMNVGFRE